MSSSTRPHQDKKWAGKTDEWRERPSKGRVLGKRERVLISFDRAHQRHPCTHPQSTVLSHLTKKRRTMICELLLLCILIKTEGDTKYRESCVSRGGMPLARTLGSCLPDTWLGVQDPGASEPFILGDLLRSEFAGDELNACLFSKKEETYLIHLCEIYHWVGLVRRDLSLLRLCLSL